MLILSKILDPQYCFSLQFVFDQFTVIFSLWNFQIFFLETSNFQEINFWKYIKTSEFEIVRIYPKYPDFVRPSGFSGFPNFPLKDFEKDFFPLNFGIFYENFFGWNFSKTKPLIWRLDHNQSWNSRKNFFILVKYREKILEGFALVFYMDSNPPGAFFLQRLKFFNLWNFHFLSFKKFFLLRMIYPLRISLKGMAGFSLKILIQHFQPFQLLFSGIWDFQWKHTFLKIFQSSSFPFL